MFYRALLAECVGTFTLVFVGAFAVTLAPENGVVVPALAHGLILTGLIFSYGHLSGAHFNPAVTIAMIIGGQMRIARGMWYMVAQFSGATIAALALASILPIPGNYGQTVGSLTTADLGRAVVLEAILTFFLISAIYQASVYGRAGNFASLVIGFTLTACILAGGPYTGASLNPARTFGPALIAGDLSYVPSYLVGLFASGVVTGFLHSRLLKG